jgi:hypothetical protein
MSLSYSNRKKYVSLLLTYRKFKKMCSSWLFPPHEDPIHFEIWVIDHLNRKSSIYAFATMKEALNFVSFDDRLNTDIEYLFVRRVKHKCDTLRLNVHPVKNSIHKPYDQLCLDQKPT